MVGARRGAAGGESGKEARPIPGDVSLSTVAGTMPPPGRAALRFRAIARSPAGRFVRRNREWFFAAFGTMPVAALLTAALGASGGAEAAGMAQAYAPGVSGPAAAAAVAGAVTVSPRLRMVALSLAHAAWSAAATTLCMAGAAALAALVFWNDSIPEASWTLNEGAALLRDRAPTLLSALLTLWAMGAFLWWTVSGRASRRFRLFHHAGLFNRKTAARHEAAHALVASVLGLPTRAAWVLHRFDRYGFGGGVAIDGPPPVSTAAGLHSLIVRKVAVNVAGVVGGRGERTMAAVLRDLEFQNDWIQARELSWLGAALAPSRVLVEDVLEALLPALHSPDWRRAIEAGAKELLHAAGDPVAPEAFDAIAGRFGLALPEVEALAAALVEHREAAAA